MTRTNMCHCVIAQRYPSVFHSDHDKFKTGSVSKNSIEKRGHLRVVVFPLPSRLQILFITSLGKESHMIENVDVGVEFGKYVGERIEIGVEIGVHVGLIHRAFQSACATKLVANLDVKG